MTGLGRIKSVFAQDGEFNGVFDKTEVGEQALEAGHRQAVVGIYLGHKEVRYGGNSSAGHSRYTGGARKGSESRVSEPTFQPATGPRFHATLSWMEYASGSDCGRALFGRSSSHRRVLRASRSACTA